MELTNLEAGLITLGFMAVLAIVVWWGWRHSGSI